MRITKDLINDITWEECEMLCDQNYTWYFEINKADLEDKILLAKFEKYSLDLIKKGEKVKVIISSPMSVKSNSAEVDYIYSNETINELIQFNNKLREHGMKENIKFNEYAELSQQYFLYKEDKYEETYNSSWDLNDVINANKNIDSIVNKIKENKLSPFETMIYIHKYITSNFQYTEAADSESLEKSRVLPSIFSEGNIVCSGYASFVKAIIDKLDDPNLKCGLVGAILFNKDSEYSQRGGHCHNIIKIKDDKYKINGVYIEDACWDSKTKDFPNGLGFAHCLYPVGDLMHLQNAYYTQRNRQDRESALVWDFVDIERKLHLFANVLQGQQLSQEKEIARRRKLIKEGADIVHEFKHSSRPISLSQYARAINHVFSEMGLCGIENIEEQINQEMLTSGMLSQLIFDKKAKSQFTKIQTQSTDINKKNNSSNDAPIF